MEWNTFLANRTTEIQALTNENWNSVISSDNSADIISRGTTPEELVYSGLWWQGPSWLSQDSWPEKINPMDVPEKKEQ